MKAVNMSLIIVGVVIFVVSLLGNGLLFVLPIPEIYSSVLWIFGIVLFTIGFWLNEKEKKAK